MESENLINHRFQIISQLGNGGYGEVLKVFDTKKKRLCALKRDLIKHGNVIEEAKILDLLKGGKGIPKLYSSGKTSKFSYIVIQLLGECLSSSIKETIEKNIEVVTAIVLQSLSIIEFIHSKGILHRDIKPSQFLLGPRNLLYLVDFGISKKFANEGQHIAYHTGCHRAGSCLFASINAHSGVRLSRRDDLESLMFMIIFLFKGTLPWTNSKSLEGALKWEFVFKAKLNIKPVQLFDGLPEQFLVCFQYIRSLGFEEKPNYEYIKKLMIEVRANYGLSLKKIAIRIDANPKKNVPGEAENALLKLINQRGKKRIMKKQNTALTNQSRLENSFQNAHAKNLMATLQVSLNTNMASDSISRDEVTEKDIYPGFADRKKIFGRKPKN